MVRRQSTTAENPLWVEVAGAAPCPVCGAPAGCEVAPDDPAYARCRAVPSALPVLGGGWLHVRDVNTSLDTR